ncbi:MAG: hypothetical protein U0996_09905 [Planctomycetaceae bacterium]
MTIAIDMFLLWFILARFAGISWDEQKMRLLGLAVSIAILGGLIARILSGSAASGLLAVAGYFAAGTFCVWALASLNWPKSAKLMGIFVCAKIPIGILLQKVF